MLSQPPAADAVAAAIPEVRPPWPDEMTRLQHFLPLAFLLNPQPPWLGVAVRGAVERLVGAASLSLQPMSDTEIGAQLCLRVENRPEQVSLTVALVQSALAAAWAAGVARVDLSHTLEEDSPMAAALRELGFVTATRFEVYEFPSLPLWQRLHRIYERVKARGWFPAGAELTTLQPSVIGKVRAFLTEHLPGSASALTLENAGYKPEHSVALLLDGEVKGVLLCRRSGRVAQIGLRLIAPELRGGLPWANLFLIHASSASGLHTGMEVIRFELNPEQHPDTRQMAQLFGATLVGRRVLLGIENAENREFD